MQESHASLAPKVASDLPPNISSDGSATPVPPKGAPSTHKASVTVDGGPSVAVADSQPQSGSATIDHLRPSADGVEPAATIDAVREPSILQAAANHVKKLRQLPTAIAGYDILGVLGRGGMGVVYKARQRGLNRVVALKMILGEEASEQQLARFKVEGEAVARLQHPNIVQIYEVGEHEGRPYFSLEFVEGGSLAGKVQGEPQPPREAARIVGLLAAGIDCAHRAGIIHRDLKPANVLMTTDGMPKITDFGLAKRLEEDAGRTNSGVALGTPSYMPPEQAEGRLEEVGPLADVYALGIVLYELLTGRVPFKAPTVLETLEQVRTCEPVRPSDLQPNVPRDLETICLKCIRKERGQRYADAAALGEDLRRFLNHEPILARPVGRIERTWRWCRRNPLVAAMTTAIALVLVAWAVSMTWLSVDLDYANKVANQNEQRAKEKAEEARLSAAKATKEADLAKKQHVNALHRVTTLSEEMLGRLNARRFNKELAPEAKVLRDDLLASLRRGMLTMAHDLEESEASTFGLIRSYENMGDLLQRLGQGEEALKQYTLAYDLAEKAARDDPDNDTAQANLGVILGHLAQMQLELYGDTEAARALAQKGQKLRQHVADHPGNRAYTKRDENIQLSHFEILLGRIAMVQGNPKQAQAHFRQALVLRQAWLDETPDLPEAKSFIVEALMCQAAVDWHLGEEVSSTKRFARAVRIQEQLCKAFGDSNKFKADLAELLGEVGDGQRAGGQTDEAEASYRKAVEPLRSALKGDAGNAAYQLQLALLHERLAGLAEVKGNREAAKKGYEDSLNIFRELLAIEPNNVVLLASAFRLSAHTGKVDTALLQLEARQQKYSKSMPVVLDIARCAALGASSVGDAKAKEAYSEKLFVALNQAAQLGYRDAVALQTDPDLRRVASDPRFETFLADLAKR